MDFNSDFTERARVSAAKSQWIASPIPGVERKILDRVGDELARATSLVRYAPGSSFSEHTHSGGEEFIVLEGLFQDEHGDYPAGTYVRNPIGTRHVPRSDHGCVIFVKLWQFDPADRVQFYCDLYSHGMEQSDRGIDHALLHQFGDEVVSFERWQAGSSYLIGDPCGAEVFVLEGSIAVDGCELGRWDWFRVPPGDSAEAKAGLDGAVLWFKSGHLCSITIPS